MDSSIFSVSVSYEARTGTVTMSSTVKGRRLGLLLPQNGTVAAAFYAHALPLRCSTRTSLCVDHCFFNK